MSVTGLCRKIKKSKVSVYNAVVMPHRFSICYQLIEETLLNGVTK